MHFCCMEMHFAHIYVYIEITNVFLFHSCRMGGRCPLTVLISVVVLLLIMFCYCLAGMYIYMYLDGLL